MNDKIKLKDACKILNGFAFKSGKYVDSGIRIIRIANVQKGYVEDERPVFYPNSEESSIRDYMLEEDDLLLSLTGNVGRVALLDKRWLPAALNQRVACLRIKDDRIIKDYLYFALLSDKFENDCTESSKGIAQKNMSTEWLKDYEIPLPSGQKQREIISSLKQLSMIIKNKTEQIQQLDDLIKARFVEMFNMESYPIKPLSEIAEYWNGLTYKPSDVSSDGTIVLRSSNIQDMQLDLNDIVRVKCKINNKKMVKTNDILMCSRNGSAKLVGKVALIPELEEMMSFGAFMMIIRSAYYPYLMTYFQLPVFRSQISTGTTTINQITRYMLDKVSLPVPDMAKIKGFKTFVTQVDKSKFAVQKSLEKTQLLFDSLMQEYFG